MTGLLLYTRVEVNYAGTNITQDIAPDLLSFSYTDNEGGKADDVSLTLKNDHGRWSGAWAPARGDKITATIVQEGEGAGAPLYCGSFTVDEIEDAGPPAVISIRGTSMPTESKITRTKESKAWENVPLSEIVADIANAGDMEAVVALQQDPVYDRRDQREETPLAFLQRVCGDEGFELKCTDDQLVVFDPRELEKAPPVLSLVKGKDNIKSWRFTAQNHDIYSSATVEYLDPETGKLKKYTHNQPGMAEGKTKKVVKRASSIAEAARMAEAALYAANRGEVTGSLSVVGDTRLIAGATVNVSGFGRFDGKYFVRTAAHSVSSGYSTSVELNNTREESDDDDLLAPDMFNIPKTPTPRARGGSDGLEEILGS